MTDDATAQLTADILLEIQAVHIRPDEPFTFTSGRLSPVYVDCRKIISFPRARAKLMAAHDPIARPELGHTRSDRDHLPRRLAARNERRVRPELVFPGEHQNVHILHAACADSHLDLPLGRRRRVRQVP